MSDKHVTNYVFTIRVVNCPSRNVALEVLDIFGRIGKDHVLDIQKEFTGPLVKLGQFIQDLPNVLPGLQSTLASAEQIAKTINATIAAMASNNSCWIRHDKYDLKGLRMPTKASRVGKGFGSKAKIELARSLMGVIESELDFVKNSAPGTDQFLAFLPKDRRWDEVRTIVAQYWNEDEFFATELFNGVNPYTVKIAKPADVHEEFKHLARSNGELINLNDFEHGDLFVS